LEREKTPSGEENQLSRDEIATVSLALQVAARLMLEAPALSPSSALPEVVNHT
jgi:hypothetical protein